MLAGVPQAIGLSEGGFLRAEAHEGRWCSVGFIRRALFCSALLCSARHRLGIARSICPSHARGMPSVLRTAPAFLIQPEDGVPIGGTTDPCSFDDQSGLQ